MWIKILCIEYILWGIPTIESTFDVANMVKSATVKDVPINNDALLNHTDLLNSCLGKWHLLPYLVVPVISARAPLISTRVSAHCQAILFAQHPFPTKLQRYPIKQLFPLTSYSSRLLGTLALITVPSSAKFTREHWIPLTEAKSVSMSWCHHVETLEV